MIEIRKTTPDDVADLKTTLLRIWHDTYDSFLGASRVTKLAAGWHTPEKLVSETETDKVCSLLALDKGRIVGHALMYEPNPRIIHLARLYLDHDYHEQGIGKALLNAAIAAYPHAHLAYLEVYEPNLRAVAFYKAQGFGIVAKTRDAYTDEVLFEYRMEKDLTK